MSFPGGKHRIELATQIMEVEGEHSEYGIGVDYIESNYAGAGERLQYLWSVLGDLGFKFEKVNVNGRGSLQASLSLSDRSEWEKKFPETVRLMYSLLDLDMDAEWTQRYARDLFDHGITDMDNLGRQFLILQDKKSTKEEKANAVRIFFKSGGLGEKEAVVRLLLRKGRPYTEIADCVSELTHDKMEDLLNIMDSLIESAYQQDDKNEQNRLVQKYDFLQELVDQRNIPPSVSSPETQLENQL
jgi:hypothetical protein